MRCWQCPRNNNNNDNKTRGDTPRGEGGDVREAGASVAQPTGQSKPAEKMPSHNASCCRIGRRLSLRCGTRKPHRPTSSSPHFFLSLLSPVKLHDFTHTHITHSRTCDDEGKKKRKNVATPARGRGRRGWQRSHLHSTRAPPRTHSLGRTGLSQSPPSREEEGKGGGVEGLIAWPSSGALSSRASSSSSGGKRWPCVSPASSPFDSAQCRPGLPSCWGSPPP